jgi:hypothetical protein
MRNSSALLSADGSASERATDRCTPAQPCPALYHRSSGGLPGSAALLGGFRQEQTASGTVRGSRRQYRLLRSASGRQQSWVFPAENSGTPTPTPTPPTVTEPTAATPTPNTWSPNETTRDPGPERVFDRFESERMANDPGSTEKGKAPRAGGSAPTGVTRHAPARP